MSEKVTLPRSKVVSQWNEEKVIKWLKKVHLEDCIPAFEIRHIDGLKLLDLTEQKLFTYQDLKIKHRKQIAKCVQECKSQASNAKRIAKTLKQNNGTHSQDVESNGTCDSGEDSDDWGSDFEDSEEEIGEEEPVPEVNNNCIIQDTQPDTPEIESNTKSVLQTAILEKNIPKPPDVPIISKTVNGSSVYKNGSANTIPRPPLKRPPSQPPPPPIQQVTNSLDLQEDYEIPIVSTSTSFNSYNLSDSPFPSSTCSESSGLETYEIVQPPEENYEIVDLIPKPSTTPTLLSAPATCLNMTEKPLLPPRHLKTPLPTSPPPLPQKPFKLKDTSDRVDGVRTFSRPKLPFKAESEAQPETTHAVSPPQSNVGFISSLIGRRSSSTPSSSPKTRQRNNSFSVASSPPTNLFIDSGSSSSLSPDKDGSLFDGKKIQPLPPLPPRGTLPVIEDSAQNMATRPLPPVPNNDKSNSNHQITQDIQQCPWFHEIEREAAEAAVKKLNEAGSFVVRPSKRAGKENPYSLTVLHEDRLFHLNIRQRSDNTFALGKEKEKEKAFTSVRELITFHLSEPILLKNRGEPAGKTILRKYPEKS